MDMTRRRLDVVQRAFRIDYVQLANLAVVLDVRQMIALKSSALECRVYWLGSASRQSLSSLVILSHDKSRMYL